jgi:ABC-type polar amino acid transport system ATPase subunit
MSLFEVAGLAKRFGTRPIFSDISLSMSAGEAVVITGASGSGKTTFLRCCNGLESADEGSVRLRDLVLVAGDSPERLRRAASALRRKVGMVFQGSNLFSHRTVIENLIEGPVFVGRRPRAQSRAAALTLLETVGVAARADAYPRELSGGEQQRVALARALAMSPEVLLLDEPTSGLDGARVDSLVALLRGIVDAGQTILAVTHDLRFAGGIASRRLHMIEGRLDQAPP